MKKWIFVLCLFLMIVGCEKKEEAVTPTATPTQTTESSPTPTPEEKQENEIDLDLTFMSATAIYSEVSNMMLYPEKYEGKRVRINGLFSIGYDMNSQPMYGCIIPDATACCIQGIAFNWKGEHTYPQDYPEQNESLVVEGIFTYEKDGSYIQVCLDEADIWFGEKMKEVMNPS